MPFGRPSTFRDVAIATAVLLVTSLAARRVEAQACCSGASALTPGRLFLHEDALVGVQARAGAVVGSWDDGGRWVRSPAETSETDLEQDAIGTVRVLERGQASLLVPVVETRRTVPGRAEFGGGLGDVQLGGRWDFTLAGDASGWPGIAVLGGVTAPTGRAPEAATKPLATDATGAGSWRFAGGFGVEQTWDRLFAGVTGTVTLEAPRTALGLRVTRPPLLGAFAAFGTIVGRDGAIALTLSYAYQGDGVIDGTSLPDSARRSTRAGLASGFWIAHAWRVQLGGFGDVPFSSFGRNEPASVGVSMLLMRSWS